MSRSKTGSILAIVIFGFLIGGNDLHGFTKAGTSAAQFLKLEVGARAAALGGAAMALPDPASSMYWNPAGILETDHLSAAFHQTNWFLDVNHIFAGFSVRINRNVAMGGFINALYTGDQEVTTVQEEDGNGLYYSVNDLAIGISLAKRVTDRLAVGFSGKFIQENYYNETATAFAVDIGSILLTDFHGLRIGMAISNFGSDISFEGRDLISKSDVDNTINGNYLSDSRLETETWPLPLMFRVGIALPVIGAYSGFLPSRSQNLCLYITGEHPNDNRERISVGCEYSMLRILTVRFGYKFNHDTQDISLGGGLRIPFDKSKYIIFDYALAGFSALQNVSRYSLSLMF